MEAANFGDVTQALLDDVTHSDRKHWRIRAPSYNTAQRIFVRCVSSCIAGVVSFMVCTIIGISFAMLVFSGVPGGVPLGIQLVTVGVNIAGNLVLVIGARLPCVVVTADNGILAPIAADLVRDLAMHIDDREALLATAVAGISLGCAAFGLLQLLLVKFNVVRLVQYLPYSIPMGFLSGIGLELCSALPMAGGLEARVCAIVFALVLALAWRGYSLSVLFPSVLFVSITGFYLCGGPSSWLLDIDEMPSFSGVGLWAGDNIHLVQWRLLLRLGHYRFVTFCLLGCLQNCLFAGLFARAPGLEAACKPNDVLLEFGQAFMAGGLSGCIGGFHNMACFSLSRDLNSYARAPQLIVASLSLLLCIVGLGPLLCVPRFVFAGLLMWIGLKFLRTYFYQSAKMIPRSEAAIVACVALIMRFGGFGTGVLSGLLLALFSTVLNLASMRCVQQSSTGCETRSNVVRSVSEEKLLLTYGQGVLILRLASGFVFFATSAQLLEQVEKRLDDVAPPLQTLDPLRKPVESWKNPLSPSEEGLVRQKFSGLTLSNLVIDFTLCRGFDGSLVCVLHQLAELGTRHRFKISLAGLQSYHIEWLSSHPIISSVCQMFADLDRALASVENDILSKAGRFSSKETISASIAHAGWARQITHDKHDGLHDIMRDEWSLVLLYSNLSAASRSARPVMAQVMVLLEGQCSFYEASLDICPALLDNLGHRPALILLHSGKVSLRWNFTDNSSRGSAIGIQPNADAVEIAIAVKEHIRFSKTVAFQSDGQSQILSPPTTVFQSHEARLDVPRPLLPPRTRQPAWTDFLELLGLHNDSNFVDVGKYVTGPKQLDCGSALFYKGMEPRGLFFIVNGFVALWIEGSRHNQDYAGSSDEAAIRKLPNENRLPTDDLLSEEELPPRDTSSERKVAPNLAQTRMLSTGTFRFLRTGPGWVHGSLPAVGVRRRHGWRHSLEPYTCLAESEVQFFELSCNAAQAMMTENTKLSLDLQELVARYSNIILSRMSGQLSTWQSLVFGEQTDPESVGAPVAMYEFNGSWH